MVGLKKISKILLALMVLCHARRAFPVPGGIGDGGGHGLPENQAHVFTEQEMPAQIEDAKKMLKFVLYAVEDAALNSFYGPFLVPPFIPAAPSAAMQTIFSQTGPNRISQLVDQVKIITKLDGDCNDPFGNSTDASFNTDYPGAICISPSSLANSKHTAPGSIVEVKIDSTNAMETIVPLLAHELYHFYSSNEKEALEIQTVAAGYAFREPTNFKSFEEDLDNMDRIFVFGLRDMKKHFKNYQNSADPVVKCANIAAMMGTPKWSFSKSYNLDIPHFDNANYALLVYSMRLIETLRFTCGLNESGPPDSFLESFNGAKQSRFLDVMTYVDLGVRQQINYNLGDSAVVYQTNYLDFQAADMVLEKALGSFAKLVDALVADTKNFPDIQFDVNQLLSAQQ